MKSGGIELAINHLSSCKVGWIMGLESFLNDAT
jgi:hypothetical protein